MIDMCGLLIVTEAYVSDLMLAALGVTLLAYVAVEILFF
jgi:hypothetical protein